MKTETTKEDREKAERMATSYNMKIQIGSTVEFRHAGVNWRGRVFNIIQAGFQITVDGYEAMFLIPKDYSMIWPI